MLFKNHENSKILLTTPDYPPKLGGLSTYCKSIESSLKELGVEFDVFVWENLKELKSFSAHKRYDCAFHIHFFGHHFLKSKAKKHVNFLHGSEVLFTSPNIFKRIYKKLTKSLFLKTLKSAHNNIFISEFTFSKLEQLGLSVRYDRDFVFHNCINLNSAAKLISNFNDDTLKLVCLARDVPHKNLNSLFDLAKVIGKVSGKTIKLFSPKDFPESEFVKSINISGVSDNERDNLLKEAHFNLLLSLDHSKKGFYEGFGLTVLEAGKFATPSIVSPFGGLPEAVHHNKTGWVVRPSEESFANFFKSLNKETYDSIANQCYLHTLESHDENLYVNLINNILRN